MRVELASLVLLVLLAPTLAAQQAPASPASFLVYRPWPDALGDPLSSALAPPPFEAARIPATRIDRSVIASAAPENQPESAPAHYREMLRLVQLAEAEGASVALVVDGDVAPGKLAMRIEARGAGDANLSLVVFEHGVALAGRVDPYVARFATAPQRIATPGNATLELRLDPAWNVDDLGVVALVERDGRVLQSATWLPRQDGPTEQVARAPLVEHVTASWCEPCVPSDEAFLLLATQRGAAGPLDAADQSGYLRAPDARLYGGLVAGLALAFVLLRRRA